MTVISEVEGVECDEREYPWLGVSNDAVVLFCANGTGTVVASGDSDWLVGDYAEDWDIDMFDAFPGRVKLSNDGVEIIVLDDEAGD